MINSVLSAGYTQSATSTRQSTSLSSSEAAASSTDSVGDDTVTLSNTSKLLSSLFPLAQEGFLTIEDLEDALAKTNASVESSLQALYQDLGITASSGMELSVDVDGTILVDGDSQEASALAEAINADPELSHAIRQASANTSLLNACYKYL